MSQVHPEHRWLRPVFLTAGIVLCLAPNLVAYFLFNGRWLATHLYPGDLHSQISLLRELSIGVKLAGLLCLATSWGMKRDRGWSRSTGLLSSLLLLFGFPILTLAGAVGVFVLLRNTAERPGQPQVEEFWSHNSRDSLVLSILSSCVFFSCWRVVPKLAAYAMSMGLPPVSSAMVWTEVWFFALLFGTLVHEMAHATVAWATHSRVLAINVGPFTVTMHPRLPWGFQFDWKKIFAGGYVGAVPRSGENVRERETLIVLAGPLSSFFLSVALCLIFLNLSGSSWAEDWPFFGFGAVLNLGVAVANLLPFGYTDGTMLLHLLAWTRHGKELVAIRVHSGYELEGDLARADGEWDAALEYRTLALKAASQEGIANPTRVAVASLSLGYAQVAVGRRGEAEASFLAALSAPGVADPRITGACWRMLHHLYALEHRVPDSRRVYASAVATLGEWKQSAMAGAEKAHAQLYLADLQLEARFLERASDEATAAIGGAHLGSKHPVLKASLYRVLAESQLSFGDGERGLPSAAAAEQILRSGKIDEADYNFACQALGGLGQALWNCGRDDLAIAMVKDVAGLLEGRTQKYWRLRLAEILCAAGRWDDAEAALPKPEELPPSLRGDFRGVRAALFVRTGRAEQAVADGQEVLRLAGAGCPLSPTEVALAQSALAHFCLEAGRPDEAASLAEQALEPLAAAAHPQSLAAAVTLARVGWRNRQTVRFGLEEALVRLRDDNLTRLADKARLVGELARWLERDQRKDETVRLRLEAQQYWRRLQVPVPPEPAAPAGRTADEYAAARAN